jgi:hypothetical protein
MEKNLLPLSVGGGLPLAPNNTSLGEKLKLLKNNFHNIIEPKLYAMRRERQRLGMLVKNQHRLRHLL